MKLLFWMSILLLLTFPMYNSPMSLGAVLILLSFSFVSVMSLVSSWWYAYILFLVYIGGLLVMFIYVCLISSNQSFQASNSYIGLVLLSFIISYVASIKPVSKSFMGAACSDMGEGLVANNSLWLFGGLVVLLLAMMLVVVRSSGAGAVSVS